MQDELRERVLQAERAVMYALGFNMSILHPYRIALNLVNERGFRLKMHTPLRNNLYDLPQIIFNVTNIRQDLNYAPFGGLCVQSLGTLLPIPGLLACA